MKSSVLDLDRCHIPLLVSRSFQLIDLLLIMNLHIQFYIALKKLADVRDRNILPQAEQTFVDADVDDKLPNLRMKQTILFIGQCTRGLGWV